MVRLSALRSLLRSPSVRAGLLAAGWEVFSALLFVSAVVPAAFTTPWPAIVFLGSIALSAVLARPLLALGLPGFALAGAVRTLSWPLAVAPLLAAEGPRVIVAALAFGLMAGGMRFAVYRRFLDVDPEEAGDADLGASLSARLSEAAMMAGIVGGHVMLLFSVAFLRTQSKVIFHLWFEIVPILALLGTGGFTLAVRPATRTVLAALAAGPDGDRAVLTRAIAHALRLPDRLAYLNFGVWFGCTAIGILRVRPGPASWQAGDAVMELAFGSLFASGVAFYQRAWHRDALRPVIERLRRWTGTEASAEPTPLRRRMLLDFGLPLLFTATLSLFSSIGLYRTLGSNLSLHEDFNAISALFASFAMLVLAGGGVVARAARELSRPMTQLARAADLVARGELDAAVPRVSGPVEVVGLGESVERMRVALGHTIGELSAERAGLEQRVEARTAELRRTLDELRRAQAALIQGERLASIGELVSGVAHEIYNPLNAIAGAAEPLGRLAEELRGVIAAYRAAEAELPPERRLALETMRREVDLDASLDDLVGISTVVRRASERSVRIVTNLKNFSRATGESLPTDLHAGLEETLMLLGPRLREASIQVTRRYGELPSVVCRTGELNQVFMNLLVNAIQALEQGTTLPPSTEVPVPPEPEIRIETALDGDVAVVTVSDNGPGVPPALEKRIFDPFFTTKPRGQGTGLGLSISTDIVRRHGGTLLFERPEQGGARFRCRLPLVSRPGPGRRRAAGRREGPTPASTEIPGAEASVEPPIRPGDG